LDRAGCVVAASIVDGCYQTGCDRQELASFIPEIVSIGGRTGHRLD